MFTLVLTLGLSIFATCASPQQLLLQGRFASDVSQQTGLASLPVTLSWPASSVYTSFDGNSITVSLSALPGTVISSQYSRFAIYLDQQQVAIEATSIDNPAINWETSALGSGRHNLTITKLSEAAYGSASLDTLSVGPGGRRVMQLMTCWFMTALGSDWMLQPQHVYAA